MGGRGSSSGGGFGGAGEQFIADSDGSNIDLGDAKLKYGGDDKAVSGVLRTALTAQEEKRTKAQVEYARAYDVNGFAVGSERRGGKGSVSLTYQMANSQVVTHNHPREAGVLGGTFSNADIRNWAIYGMQTHRASAKEGTYSITKGKNFDVRGTVAHCSSVERNASKAHNERMRTAKEDYRSGKITYKQYEAAYNRSFNRLLVDMHNGYAEGAKQYGYTYTLERRTGK